MRTPVKSADTLAKELLIFLETESLSDDRQDWDEYEYEQRSGLKNRVQKFLKRKKIRGAKFKSGVFRLAVILPFAVLKLPIKSESVERFPEEATFIKRMRSTVKYKRHFPVTRLVVNAHNSIMNRYCLVQEVIKMNKKEDYQMNKTERFFHDESQRLAGRLGLGDMHEWNYGWKGDKNKKYPVYVDCEFCDSTATSEGMALRSWMK
jgi:hypothetical protein